MKYDKILAFSQSEGYRSALVNQNDIIQLLVNQSDIVQLSVNQLLAISFSF